MGTDLANGWMEEMNKSGEKASKTNMFMNARKYFGAKNVALEIS